MNLFYQQSSVDYRRYGKGILFSNGCALNETAVFVFDMCNGNTSFSDMVEQMYEEYECEKEIISRDIKQCLLYMLENELIFEIQG